jgi:putative glutamine amidotransferase
MKIFIFNSNDLATNYLKAIKNCNANFIISNKVEDCLSCTHLLLCGGGDINPFFYNESPVSSNDIDDNRDLSELYLINYFYKRNLPILGICRGMQILNIAFGGNLRQAIVDKELHYSSNGDCFHFVNNCHGFTKLLYGKSLKVNSKHKQCVNKIANSFLPCSFSDDGICEAIEHQNGKILGVQFHPERLKETGLRIYDYFINLK